MCMRKHAASCACTQRQCAPAPAETLVSSSFNSLMCSSMVCAAVHHVRTAISMGELECVHINTHEMCFLQTRSLSTSNLSRRKDAAYHTESVSATMRVTHACACTVAFGSSIGSIWSRSCSGHACTRRIRSAHPLADVAQLDCEDNSRTCVEYTWANSFA